MEKPEIDSATLDLIERVDVYLEGMDEDAPDPESANALEIRLAALQLRLARLADERDPAGNATLMECHREDCPECAEIIEIAGLDR